MKKLYSFLAVAFASATIFAQAFTATYDFAESLTSADAGSYTGSNFTTSLFSGSGISYISTTTNRYANSGASLAGLDTGVYMEVTVTPASSYKMSISSISMRLQRSGTGPRDFAVRTSVDGFATNLPATVDPVNAELTVIAPNVFHYVNDISTGQSGATITPTTINDITAPITIRIYPFNAEAASGTFSVDDVVISGTVVSTLAVSDLINANSNFVKNTFIDSDINFGAKADVKIFSMNGQVVKSASVSENKSMNVADLAPGMYIVTGMVNGQAVSQKIMKK